MLLPHPKMQEKGIHILALQVHIHFLTDKSHRSDIHTHFLILPAFHDLFPLQEYHICHEIHRLHKNLSPYNAYKQGKLVKLPFLGSQYINLND